MHSHILPGLDDGSPNVHSSVQLVKAMKQLGIEQAIATPHIHSSKFLNNFETISASAKLLIDELDKNEIDFKLNFAAEYFMDEYFLALLDSGEKLLTLKDNFILTEFSFRIIPENVEKIIYKIISNGYKAILAHPERYVYWQKDIDMYRYLAELGFKLQVNLGSVSGYYGSEPQNAAELLLENDLVSYLGTDTHRQGYIDSFVQAKENFLFSKYLGNKIFNEDLRFS